MPEPESTNVRSGPVDARSAVRALREELVAVAVPVDAEPMRRYMRDQFPYLGVKTAARRRASRALLEQATSWDAVQLTSVIDECWRQPEREFRYVGADLAGRRAVVLDPANLDDLRRWITTDSWWDTVDPLASHAVGTVVRRHPSAGSVMDEWIDDEDFWVARAAILHQLRFGEATDSGRLFDYVLRRGAEDEFFLRKAAGWALRTYARVDPMAVADFVDRNADRLSPLTRREALKHLR